MKNGDRRNRKNALFNYKDGGLERKKKERKKKEIKKEREGGRERESLKGETSSQGYFCESCALKRNNFVTIFVI